MLQLGWKATPEQFPPTELTNYAIDAEKAGFDLIDCTFLRWLLAVQLSPANTAMDSSQSAVLDTPGSA
jgi:hypothetical protein